VLLAGELDRGKRVPGCDRDERVGLVVTVVDVERRIELPDEVLLEDEALDLVIGHHIVERGDLGHHQRHLLAIVLAEDVLAHPLAERLRLADVEDLAGLAFHR
jgi:phosphoribosyl 1,2-cyclic phosphodiesterase